MPSGWMEQATAPGRNYAQAIQSVGGAIAGGINKFYEGKQMAQQGKASAPTMMSQYEQVSQATGQQMDPTLVERYKSIDTMSGPQVQQFNEDVMAAQQNQMGLFNLQRQKQAMNLAAQNLALQRASQGVANMIGARNQPSLPQAAPMPTSQPSYSAPSASQYYFGGMTVPGELLGGLGNNGTIQMLNR